MTYDVYLARASVVEDSINESPEKNQVVSRWQIVEVFNRFAIAPSSCVEVGFGVTLI